MTRSLLQVSRVATMATMLAIAGDLLANDDKPAISLLVSQLHSMNPPPHIDRTGKPIAIFPSGYDWHDQKRVLSAWKQLHERAHEALPELIASCHDDSYCVTFETPSGAWKNMTVGECCRYIVKCNVNLYKRPYLRDGITDDLISAVDITQEHKKAGLLDVDVWWVSRRDKSLYELQLESVRWARRRLKEREASSTEDSIDVKRRQEIIKELDELEAQLCAERPGNVVVPWHSREEITFRMK